MGKRTLATTITADPERVWNVMTDPLRLPYWMRLVEGVEDSTGHLGEPGSRHQLRIGPGMRVTLEVLDARRPERYAVRATAFGATEEAVVTLTDVDDGTRFSAEVLHHAHLGLIGRLLELVHLRGYEWLDRKVMLKLKELAERPMPVPELGALYSLDCGGTYRVARVIGLDPGVVHLRLFAGSAKTRPGPGDAVDLRVDPITPERLSEAPPLRGSFNQFRRGQPLLQLDGGAGALHAPFGLDAFGDADPILIARGHPEADASSLVEQWRVSGQGWFGSFTPRLEPATERQLETQSVTVLPVTSLHALPGWRAAAADLAAGRLWKARDRLQGLLRTFPLNPEVLDLLGEIHYRMGDHPAAARHWFLSGRDDDPWRAVEPALHERYPVAADLRAALPIRGPAELYPPVAQDRLLRLEEVSPRREGPKPAMHPERVPAPSLRSRIALVGAVLLVVLLLVLGALQLLGFLIGLVF